MSPNKINEHHAKYLLANATKITELVEEAFKYLKDNNLPDLMQQNLEREEDRQTLNKLAERLDKVGYDP